MLLCEQSTSCETDSSIQMFGAPIPFDPERNLFGFFLQKCCSDVSHSLRLANSSLRTALKRSASGIEMN